MKRVLEYYVFICMASIAAVYMLYVVITPLPATRVRASSSVAPPAVVPAVIPKSGIPSRLVVPSIGIDMPIKVGDYNINTKLWTVTDTEIFYANTSVPANDTNGTTLIYGHARWGVFGALPDIQPDALAEVYTDSGFRFEYRYASMQKVAPTNTSVFTEKGEPKLLLQTCTGPWDSERALYSFAFVGEKQ